MLVASAGAAAALAGLVFVAVSINIERILEHAGQKLARYKLPREIFVVDTLPRTANGKLLRRALVRPEPQS